MMATPPAASPDCTFVIASGMPGGGAAGAGVSAARMNDTNHDRATTRIRAGIINGLRSRGPPRAQSYHGRADSAIRFVLVGSVAPDRGGAKGGSRTRGEEVRLDHARPPAGDLHRPRKRPSWNPRAS